MATEFLNLVSYGQWFSDSGHQIITKLVEFTEWPVYFQIYFLMASKNFVKILEALCNIQLLVFMMETVSNQLYCRSVTYRIHQSFIC